MNAIKCWIDVCSIMIIWEKGYKRFVLDIFQFKSVHDEKSLFGVWISTNEIVLELLFMEIVLWRTPQ